MDQEAFWFKERLTAWQSTPVEKLTIENRDLVEAVRTLVMKRGFFDTIVTGGFSVGDDLIQRSNELHTVYQELGLDLEREIPLAFLWPNPASCLLITNLSIYYTGWTIDRDSFIANPGLVMSFGDAFLVKEVKGQAPLDRLRKGEVLVARANGRQGEWFSLILNSILSSSTSAARYLELMMNGRSLVGIHIPSGWEPAWDFLNRLLNEVVELNKAKSRPPIIESERARLFEEDLAYYRDTGWQVRKQEDYKARVVFKWKPNIKIGAVFFALALILSLFNTAGIVIAAVVGVIQLIHVARCRFRTKTCQFEVDEYGVKHAKITIGVDKG